MKINLKARAKNKVFWLTMIPAVCLLVSQVCRLFGVEIDLTLISEQLTEIIETLFLIVGVLGIVVDPTTKGVGDSERALEYTEPM
jgi:phi LC3 family holin